MMMPNKAKQDLKKLIGDTLNKYYQQSDLKDEIEQLRFKDEYQDRLIRYFMSDVTNKFVDTPLTVGKDVNLINTINGVMMVKQIVPKATETDDNSMLKATGEIGITIVSANLDKSLSENPIYKSSILNITLDKPLYRGLNYLSNKEVYDEINGVNLIRRWKEILLTGDEEWTRGKIKFDSDGKRLLTFNTVLDKSEDLRQIAIMADKFSKLKTDNTEGVEMGYNNNFRILIRADKLNGNDNEEGFKEYLKANPIRIVCERANPLKEQIIDEIYMMDCYEGETFVNITDEVNGLTPQVVFSYYPSSVVRESVAMASVQAMSNDADVNDNIIPYLMDMEMNLMSLDDDNGGDDI